MADLKALIVASLQYVARNLFRGCSSPYHIYEAVFHPNLLPSLPNDGKSVALVPVWKSKNEVYLVEICGLTAKMIVYVDRVSETMPVFGVCNNCIEPHLFGFWLFNATFFFKFILQFEHHQDIEFGKPEFFAINISSMAANTSIVEKIIATAAVIMNGFNPQHFQIPAALVFALIDARIKAGTVSSDIVGLRDPTPIAMD